MKNMKLILESWRQYTMTEQSTPQNYSSVNIDNATAQLLLSKVKELGIEVPEGFSPKEGTHWRRN